VLALGEGQTVEFKAKANAPVVGQQVCAFLNSGGGYLVLGVADDGQPVGLPVDADVRHLEQQVMKSLSPSALVSFEMRDVQGKTVWVVEVPAGQDIPYSFRDEVFVRAGESTRRADVATLRDMIMRRQVEPERWERRFSDADLLQDLDQDEIKRAVQRGQSTHRSESWAERPDGASQALERLSLVKYGRLTNGGDVLFGKNPAQRHPQVRVRCAAFATDKTDDAYRDFKNFEGPLVSVLDEVFAYIRRNTPSLSVFKPGALARQDRGLYPDEALREGLVNAFAHRDYADFRGGIRVQVFPRRVEIWNSGSLPEGVTPDGLVKGQISILRNPDIAHVLYLQGFMEKLGRGGVLIDHACREQGLPAPEWRSDARGVTLIFRATEVTPEVTPEVVPEVTRLVSLMEGEASRQELQQRLGLKDSEHFRKTYLLPALAAKAVEMTLPDKPTSRMQRYRLTPLGKRLRQPAS
jgi:ATP-dependent DNA helicase RecG